MRKIVFLVILMTSSFAVWSQQPLDPFDRAAVVKNAVGTIAGSRKKSAEVILNDLREFNGKIVGVDHDHFILRPDRNKGWPKITIVSIGAKPPSKVVNLRYRDVLQISSKSAVLSFVPDPATSPYSTWGDVASIGLGEFVQVHLLDGRRIEGVFYRWFADSLSLMRGNKEKVVAASQVAKVFRIKGDLRNLGTKILTGGSRGEDTEPWLGLCDAMRSGDLVLMPVAAAIGGTMYLLPIGKTSRVLVYSR